MKIKVSNLGPITGPEEFDLKPLTIFIGPNNAGKTWLAYLLAGIFSDYGYGQYMLEVDSDSILADYPMIRSTIDNLLETGTATLDFYQFAEEYGEKYINHIARLARDWLTKFLSSRRIKFDNLNLSIELGESKKAFLDRAWAASVKMDFGLPPARNVSEERQPLLSINKKKEQKELYFYTFSQEDLNHQLPRELIEQRFVWAFFLTLHRMLFSNVTVLPTERTTFITFRFNEMQQATTEETIQVFEHITRQSDALTSFPIPVSTYLGSAIHTFRKGPGNITKRERAARREPEIKRYIELSHILAERISGGKIEFSDPQPGPEREIVFQPEGCAQSLEISLASSMVKELTPLIFYLRYTARPGDLLIIDEPEMNLHPKAQVQVLEFLAMLVAAGLHVLITTHSPYIIDHISNLFLANQHADPDAISSEFFLQDKRAFISKKDAAVYLVNNGTITDASDEEQDWDTFGEISDRIADIYFKL
jgi:hypothetical protein